MSTTTLPELATVEGTWTIDASHSSVGFVVTHAMVTKVRGQFDDFDGTVTVTGENAADVDVHIRTASVNTNQTGRDEHLRSADFFEAETFPEMTFVGTGLEIEDAEEFTLNGDLTIKGITRPVSLKVETGGMQRDAYGALRAGFEGVTTISRKDFGLTWNVALEAGGVLVSDKIKIQLDIALVKND